MGKSVPQDKAGNSLTSIAHQAKDIVQCLEGVVPAFESAVIGSDDYRDKALLVNRNVKALAQLHPNWSDERKIILSRHRHSAPQLDDTDPFILIYEFSEVMFRTWHQMRVTHPSIRTLAKHGEAFREALTCLKNECTELTNRKHKHQPTAPTRNTHPAGNALRRKPAENLPVKAEKEGNP